MKKTFVWLLAGVTLAAVISGCATPKKAAGTSNLTPSGPAPKTAPSGAQLWAQTCGHCHNIRSPYSYSDAQWDIVMLHMRVRANLTPAEHKEILAFLKSAY